MRKRAAVITSHALLVMALGVTACAMRSTMPGAMRPLAVMPPAAHLASAVSLDKLTTATRQLAYEGIKALDAGDYLKASRLFNLALKSEINSSGLHFFNAYAYHMRAMSGEGALYDLAKQGYELAIQFDPSNVAARHYLGLLLMDRHQFVEARTQLMQAALYTPDDPDLLYDLAVACYYAHDVRTAYAAIQGLRELQGDKPDERTLRAAAIVAAASGDAQSARDDIAQMKHLNFDPADTAFVTARVAAWGDANEPVKVVPVQFGSSSGFPGSSFPGSGFPGSDGAQSSPGSPAYPGSGGYSAGPAPGASAYASGARSDGAASFYDKNMVNLEVVLISDEENNNDTFGVNLLDGLGVQFGDPSLGTPAASWSTGSSRVTGIPTSTTTSITRLIQIPGVTYSLNIANSTDSHSEVLARPSLVAMGGQASTFFSGVDIVGAAVSTGQGGSVQVQKETGIKLTVTPEFLPDNLIKLRVDAERAFLTNPSSTVLFDFRLDTDRTEVSANVVMKYGETLILSGLSERDIQSANNGVPGLRDVPLVQYLFSHKTKSDYYHSVIIMITPRRPSYTNRSEEDIAAERAQMSEFERQQVEFENKFRPWFKPVPSTALIFQQLARSDIFREFRSGDLELESWTSRASHAGRLRSALDFLFY